MNFLKTSAWKSERTKRMCFIVWSMLLVTIITIAYKVGCIHSGQKFWLNSTFFIGLFIILVGGATSLIGKLVLLRKMRFSNIIEKDKEHINAIEEVSSGTSKCGLITLGIGVSIVIISLSIF